jgi:predicted NACHT family NTPase
VDVWILKRVANTYQINISAFLRLFDFRNDRLGLGERIERDKGMSVANEYSRLFIFGKPGAGKTTFIKHLAVDCSEGQFQTSLVPVLIELRSIQAEGFELINVIHEELKLSDIQDTQWLLQDGKLLVLLDGLDEIPSQFRRNVQSHIRDFANSTEYNKNRFILTCRTQIIEYPPNGFKCVEVADFNERQIDLFVSNWFKASMSNKRVCYKKIRQLKTRLSRNKELCELAKTPIILSLICWVFEDSGDLPKQRSWLYRKGLDLLLRRWDGFREIKRDIGHKVYQSLTLDRKEMLLGQLSALKFQQSDNFVLFEEEDLIEQAVNILQIPYEFGRSVIRAIESQHGLLIERADEIWSFSHLTFQEYFAAKWFVERNDLEGLAKQIIGTNRDRWRQVFLLAMELTPADNLAKLFKQIIDQSILDDPKLKSFMCWIRTKANSVNTNYTASAVRALYIAFILDPSSVGSIANTFRLACELDEDISNSITHYSFDVNSVLIRNVHLDQGLSVDFSLMLILAMAIGSIPQSPQFDLDYALDHICTGENLQFDNKLQRLRDKFLSKKKINQKKAQTIHRKIDLSAATKSMPGWQGNKPDAPHSRESDSFDVSQGCWEVPDQPWVEELRNVLVEYRNIGHDWEFSQEQITKLREYCLSNEFLLSLLDEDYGVSTEVITRISRRLLSV